ncbi:MAG: radical SAM protein [Deltaproteobacteria bacterium]|nr:MAG: radical SAM protein [Deltaproteobacteria bacterium]
MSRSWALRQQIEAVLSDERGTLRKEAPVRVAMLYPSPYRAGMSSLGFQLLYREINARPDCVAERSFLPDDPAAWRSSRTPLMTWESWTPVSHHAVVAVSLAYELELPGLLECLDLAGIPLRASDRGEADPLVVLGGPLTFSNPLPAAPFADVVVMGEGEEVIHAILDAVEAGGSRSAILDRLVDVPGLYVPAVHGERLLPVIAADNVRLPGHGVIVTPHTELADMHLVEAERGCHRRCSFCVMRRSTNGGMRLAEPDAILGGIPDHARRVGLVGAAVSDHPKLVEILDRIVAGGREVGLSSLRADRLSPELMELLRAGGYRTLTVASDGASERLRVVLQKVIREQHLLQAAHYAATYGMRTLKVYMMVGVPGETDEDIDELIAFCRELSRITPTALGVAPFVAKRNTPLDRTPFAGIREVEGTLRRLQRELRGRVDVRSTSARWAWVEYALAQGGFDMADAAEAAWRAGGGFAAWKRAIRAHARDVQPPDEALRMGRPTGRFAHEAHPRA